MNRALVTIMIAGCSFPTPSEQYACTTTADCDSGRTCELGYCVTEGTATDAPRDTTQPDGARCTGWLPRHFDACTIPDPTGPMMLTTAGVYAYDTTLGTLTAPGGVAIMHASQIVATGRVISVESFELGTGVTLRVTGPHPLIVASWSTVQVAGIIDVSSTALVAGGGSNPAACATHAAVAGTTNAGGAGGGGGGGLSGSGGTGGAGDGGNAPGGSGGTAVVTTPLLVGGCSGAKGGDGDQPGGIAGKGGGAVHLTARMGLTIAATARLHAGGAAGGAGQASNGAGGGGGSGGMIGLQGATVAVASGAILAANGGGGGEGSGNQQGVNGQDARVSAVRAPGGAGGSDAGDGGAGGAATTRNGIAGANDGTYGGGGGGGGTGFIVVTSDAAAALDAAAVISPPAMIVPP